MVCKKTEPTRVTNKCDSISPIYNKGRVQFFYHSPSSKLPIRDVLNEQGKGHKTEPHIEIGAENYWNKCYQRNIIKPLRDNQEKYLFLMTTCRNETLTRHNGKRYIVGYIKHRESGVNIKDDNGKAVYFIKGDTYLFSFDDGYVYSIKVRADGLDENETIKILNHFKGRKNVFEDCIKEIMRLDKVNKTCYRQHYGYDCSFVSECLRCGKN